MGYRPNFKCLDDSGLEFYGTKLYGYADLEKLPSFKWLTERGFFDRDGDLVIFYYGLTNDLVMNADQFKEWIELYENDLINFSRYNQDGFGRYKELVDRIKNQPCSKEVWWD